MNKFKNTKGLTLVEVVVALSILTVVFSGTVTLIINVVNLAVMSKEKTEAITYAQKGLSERMKTLGYGCKVESGQGYNGTFGNYAVTTTALKGNLSGDPLSFVENADGDFIKITSTATWTKNKFGMKPYTVTEIVRVTR